MSDLDKRLVKFGIEIDGVLKEYEDLAISCQGQKWTSGSLGQATVKVTNLNKETRDYILANSSPFNLVRKLKRIYVWAGRESTGYQELFQGEIITASVSQPPDIAITMNAMTQNALRYNVLAVSHPSLTPLSVIARQIAAASGMAIDFQATDKLISNYSYSGPAVQQINKLAEMGDVHAFFDGNTVVVLNKNTPRSGIMRIINKKNGMIGIPEITEYGIKVKFLADHTTQIGGSIVLQSEMHPLANGTFMITRLEFDIANRETPFYYTAYCTRTDGSF